MRGAPARALHPSPQKPQQQWAVSVIAAGSYSTKPNESTCAGRGLRAMDEFLLNACAGSIGAMGGIVVGSPLDVIKTQLQSGRAPPGSSAASLFRTTIAAPRAMFKGVGASALSMAPNNFVMFGSYGSAMEALKLSAHAEAWSHLARVGFAGSVGGFLQSFVVVPFELIKVQQQTAAVAPDGRPPSALASVRSVVQQHGPAGLWRGARPCPTPQPLHITSCSIFNCVPQVCMPLCGVTPQPSAFTSLCTRLLSTVPPKRCNQPMAAARGRHNQTNLIAWCGPRNWWEALLPASRAGRLRCPWTS